MMNDRQWQLDSEVLDIYVLKLQLLTVMPSVEPSPAVQRMIVSSSQRKLSLATKKYVTRIQTKKKFNLSNAVN